MREISALFDRGAMGSWTDEQLLAEFLGGQEAREPALRVLIDRYGPMVLGISRRILGDEGAAEDAFQATFLVLVRRAGSLRGCPMLTNWIYGVAIRVARKERARTQRRRAVEQGTPDDGVCWPDDDAERAELRSAIDEEIGTLPEHYRLPVILCYIEGLRHDEVARRLGCPVGTVESRLSRARDRLRTRLTRRGLAPSATVLGLVSSQADASTTAAISAVAERTVAAAVGLSARRGGILAALAPGWGRRLSGLGPALQSGMAVATLVIGAGVVALGYTSGVAPIERPAALVEPPTRGEAQVEPGRPEAQAREIRAEVTEEERPKGDRPPLPREPEAPPGQVGSGTSETLKPSRASSAYAPPLTGIVIDGQLDDWPAAIPRHSIDKLLHPDPTDAMGHGGLRNANLWTSPDLSAAFSVGYGLEEQLLYLAVTVRDDKLVVGHESHLDTDAVEVYVDGLFSDRRLPFPPTAAAYEAIDPATVPCLQYVAIPGKGMIYGMRQASNPVLIHGTAKQTRTRMAYSRKGDVTIYEWAIQVFDRYPDKPTRLEPGKRIGFEIAVADRDVPASTPGGFQDPGNDRSAWIYWGPFWRGVKTLDSGALGELILVR